MGYTHYYNRPAGILGTKEQFKAFIYDCKLLFREAQVLGIRLADGHGDIDTFPIMNEDELYFNGYQEDSHETCSVERVADSTFEFCKTNRKPYDVIVQAVYIALKHHFPAVTLSSDGDQSEWIEGRLLAQRILGYGLIEDLFTEEK